MLTFFENWRLGAVRLDEIEFFGPDIGAAGKPTVRRAHLRDGKTFDTLSHDFDRIMLAPQQLIQAQPGISLVRVYVGEGQPGEILREPVIAWALCTDGEIRAVSPNGVNGGAGREADSFVEMPDGAIHAVGEWSDIAWFTDAAAMLEHFGARAARTAAAS